MQGRILTLAVALALATPALAAQGKGGDSGTHGSHGGGTASGTHHTGGGSWPPGHHGTGGSPTVHQGGAGWPTVHHGGAAFGPEYGHGGAAFGPEYGHGNSAFGPEYGRSWGHGHNHAFDSYHRAYNAPNRFHGGTYYRPHGWHYHRWNYGEFLPALFFAQSYWLMNFGIYDLPAPPPGCVWVRYGDDALLVDRDTGEIVQVIYGVFY